MSPALVFALFTALFPSVLCRCGVKLEEAGYNYLSVSATSGQLPNLTAWGMGYRPDDKELKGTNATLEVMTNLKGVTLPTGAAIIPLANSALNLESGSWYVVCVEAIADNCTTCFPVLHQGCQPQALGNVTGLYERRTDDNKMIDGFKYTFDYNTTQVPNRPVMNSWVEKELYLPENILNGSVSSEGFSGPSVTASSQELLTNTADMAKYAGVRFLAKYAINVTALGKIAGIQLDAESYIFVDYDSGIRPKDQFGSLYMTSMAIDIQKNLWSFTSKNPNKAQLTQRCQAVQAWAQTQTTTPKPNSASLAILNSMILLVAAALVL